MGQRTAFEETDEFCTCISPEYRYETKSEQYGGNIREIITGEYCTKCNKNRAPKEEEDQT